MLKTGRAARLKKKAGEKGKGKGKKKGKGSEGQKSTAPGTSAAKKATPGGGTASKAGKAAEADAGDGAGPEGELGAKQSKKMRRDLTVSAREEQGGFEGGHCGMPILLTCVYVSALPPDDPLAGRLHGRVDLC
jgi:hypothetical protein